MIGEDGRAALAFGRPPQLLAEASSIKDVVSKNQDRPVVADERFADQKRLREPVGASCSA